jgi:CBS domain-containing protein
VNVRLKGEHDMNIATLLATKGPKVVTVRPDASIRQALSLLAEHNIGALVVVDDRVHPVGILSERDVVREAARNEAVFVVQVSGLMTRNVILGVPQDDLVAVASTMTEHRIRHLPVVDGGRLVGIISIGDVVKAQRDQYQGEVDTLQTQILGEVPAAVQAR